MGPSLMKTPKLGKAKPLGKEKPREKKEGSHTRKRRLKTEKRSRFLIREHPRDGFRSGIILEVKRKRSISKADANRNGRAVTLLPP